MANETGKVDPVLAAFQAALQGSTGGRTDTQAPLGGVPVTGIRRGAGGRVLSEAEARRLNGGQPITTATGQRGTFGQFGDGYTAEDVANILRRMPPEKLAVVQRQMQASGMLPENFRAFGFVDNNTQAGFLELLEMSNNRSSGWETTLRALASGETTTEDIRKEQARRAAALSFDTQIKEFRATDPATLRRTAEAAFQEALGRNPRKDEMDRFVTRYLADERKQWETGADIEDEEALLTRARTMAGVDLEAGGDGGIDAFMLALSAQESGGNYQAVNARTGAAGKFQIMPSNWAPWAKEAGLGSNAARTPENQDRVARFKLSQYKQEFGSWDAVAVAWYAGPSAAKEYMKNPNAPRFTRKQGNGNEPSIREYAQSVMGRLGSVAGGAPEGGSESDRLWAALQRMAADAPGKITLGPRSRSYEEQVALYEKYKSGKGALAAKPGTSKHGDGRANDLKYENQAVKRWVLENAGRYGLHFPLLNAGEDWHIELVGGGQSGSAMAPVSRRFETTQIDAGARAAEAARTSNPAEYQAFGIGKQFNSLLGLLSRGVQL